MNLSRPNQPISRALKLERESRDSAPMTTRCAHCNWTFLGTAGQGREAAIDHRTLDHPELPIHTPNRRRKPLPKREPELGATLLEQGHTVSTYLERVDIG